MKAKRNRTFKPGSTVGSACLIAGSSIGIGMLALPIVTGLAGFIPSLVSFLLCFLFMGATALLLAEVSSAFPSGINIISLAQNTLGTWGKAISWLTYLFLFYSLMVAYVSKGGGIVNYALGTSGTPIFGSALVALTSAFVIFLGKRAVDFVNRLFIIGFFVSFLWVGFYGVQSISSEYLAHHDWEAFLFSVPFVITAFGFHNIVPSISDYLQRDRIRITKAIIGGGSISLVVYLLWEAVIQGNLPAEGSFSIASAFKDELISTEILAIVTKAPAVRILSFYLSFFAITTSILGQGLGLAEFLLDGLQLTYTYINRFLACLMVFAPALILAYLYPNVFFLSLELAGGLAAVILFGLMPVCMAYMCRYQAKMGQPFVPGGRSILAILGVIAASILLYEIYRLVLRFV